MLKIASIISYSSLDDLLIRLCIDNALKVSEQVIVTHCSHLYDGTRENTKTLKLLKKEYPMVDFVEYRWAKGPHSYFWHNIGRIKGREAVREELDWIYLLDADEIIDTKLMTELLNDDTIEGYDMYHFSAYWYFREPIYRAKTLESASNLLRKECFFINPNLKKNWQQYKNWEDNKRNLHNVTYNGIPVVHHFSWVRTEKTMLKKVESWGHHDDRDNWGALVKKEFSKPFSGKDFVHGYKYETVKDIFKIGRVNE